MQFFKHFLEAVTGSGQGEQVSMDGMMDMFDMLMVLTTLGVGLYCIYTCLKLRKQCYLFDSKILYPGGCKPEECLDPDGYMDYIFPRMLIFAIAMILTGILLLLNVYVIRVEWFDIVMLVLPMSFLVWYALLQRRAAKRFWGL